MASELMHQRSPIIEGEPSLSHSCPSEEEVLIRKDDLTRKKSGINAVLSDEVVDTVDPPSLTAEVPSFLKNEGIRKTLEDLAETRPDVYDAIMKNPDRMEEELKMLLEPKRDEVREEEEAENADAKLEERDAEEREPLSGTKSIASKSTRTHEKKRIPGVTVVDYPTLGMVEVFSKIQPKNSSSSAPLPPKTPQKEDVVVNGLKAETGAAPQSLSRNVSMKSTTSKGVPKVIKADSMDDSRISGMPSTDSSYYETTSIKSRLSRKSIKSALSKRTKNSMKSKMTSKSASNAIPEAAEAQKSNVSKTTTRDDEEKALLQTTKHEEAQLPELTSNALKQSKTEEEANGSKKSTAVTSDSCRDKKTGDSKASAKSKSVASASGSEKKSGDSKASTKLKPVASAADSEKMTTADTKASEKSTGVKSNSQVAEMTKKSNVEPEVSATSVTSDKTNKSNISKTIESTKSKTVSGPNDPVASEQEPSVSKQASMSEQLITPATDKSKQQQNASEISKILSDLISTAATIESKNEVTLRSRKSISSNYSEKPPELTLPPRLAKQLKTNEEHVTGRIDRKVDQTSEEKSDGGNILEAKSDFSEKKAEPALSEGIDEALQGDNKSISSNGEQVKTTIDENVAEPLIESKQIAIEEEPKTVSTVEINATAADSNQCEKPHVTDEKQEQDEEKDLCNTDMTSGEDAHIRDSEGPLPSSNSSFNDAGESLDLHGKTDFLTADNVGPSKRKKNWLLSNVINSIAAVSPRGAKKSYFSDTTEDVNETSKDSLVQRNDLSDQILKHSEAEDGLPSSSAGIDPLSSVCEPVVNAESSNLLKLKISKFVPWNKLKRSADHEAVKENKDGEVLINSNFDENSSVCTEGAVVPSTLSPQKEAEDTQEEIIFDSSNNISSKGEIGGQKNSRYRKFWKKKNPLDIENGTLDKVEEENECELQTPTSALLSSKDDEDSKDKQKDDSPEDLDNLENKDDVCMSQEEQKTDRTKSKMKLFWNKMAKTSTTTTLTKVMEESESKDMSAIADQKLPGETTTDVDVPAAANNFSERKNQTQEGDEMPCIGPVKDESVEGNVQTSKKMVNNRWGKMKKILLAKAQVEEKHNGVDIAKETSEEQHEGKVKAEKNSRKSLWRTRRIMLPVTEKGAMDTTQQLEEPHNHENLDEALETLDDNVESTDVPDAPRSLTVVNYKNLEEIEVLNKDIFGSPTSRHKKEKLSQKKYEEAAHSVLIEKKGRHPFKNLLSRKRIHAPHLEAADVTETPGDDSISTGFNAEQQDEEVLNVKSKAPAILDTRHETDKEEIPARAEEAGTQEATSSAAKSNAGESLWDGLLSYITPKATDHMKSAGFFFDFLTPKADQPVAENNDDVCDDPSKFDHSKKSEINRQARSSFSEDGLTTLSPRARLCIEEVNMNCGEITVNSEEVIHDKSTVDEDPIMAPSQDKGSLADSSYAKSGLNDAPEHSLVQNGDESLVSEPIKPQPFRALTVAVSNPKSEGSTGFDDVKDGHHTMVRAVSDEQVVAISASFAQAIASPKRLDVEEVERMVDNNDNDKKRRKFMGSKKYARKTASHPVRSSTKAASLQPASRKSQAYHKKRFNADEDISMGFDSMGDSDTIDSPTKSWGGWFW